MSLITSSVQIIVLKREGPDFGFTKVYLEHLYKKRKERVPPRRVTYSLWETTMMLGCESSVTISKMIDAGLLPHTRQVYGDDRIFHTDIVNLLRQGARRIRRDVEELMLEGMIMSGAFSRVLQLYGERLNYRIRRGDLPSFNISSGERPSYILPVYETYLALDNLQERILGNSQSVKQFLHNGSFVYR